MPDLRKNLLSGDLDHILARTENLWEEMRGKRLFITGGTGFLGCWILESLVWANHYLNLGASALVLTRDCNSFKKKAPHLFSSQEIEFHEGDVRNFCFPDREFPYVIHAAATSASATFQNIDPLISFDTIVEGTRHTLDFAVHCKAKKLLLISSGAVYGKQPQDMSHIPEDYRGGPDISYSKSVLGEGKRSAELLSAIYSRKFDIEMKIARCFSFVGPYLPLDIHYAIGNFIGDGLKGGPILVRGDGTPRRSYLYAADMIIWILTILSKGKSCLPYNVGSESELTIAELAGTVARCFDTPLEVVISKENSEIWADRYVPSTERARKCCNLHQTIELQEGIRRTIEYYISKGN